MARRYLATLAHLKGTNQPKLFNDWRRRLCGFLGIPPGPELGVATGGATA